VLLADGCGKGMTTDSVLLDALQASHKTAGSILPQDYRELRSVSIKQLSQLSFSSNNKTENTNETALNFLQKLHSSNQQQSLKTDCEAFVHHFIWTLLLVTKEETMQFIGRGVERAVLVAHIPCRAGLAAGSFLDGLRFGGPPPSISIETARVAGC
jgi:hypothetical protein